MRLAGGRDAADRRSTREIASATVFDARHPWRRATCRYTDAAGFAREHPERPGIVEFVPDVPWVLFVPLIAPHCPFRAPEPWF